MSLEVGIIGGIVEALAPVADPEVIAEAVNDYLEDHPEATCPIDDTAGEGDTGKVWSADKTAGEVATLTEAIENIEDDLSYEVRGAIFTLLSKAVYTETGLDDELATVQAWATPPSQARFLVLDDIAENTGLSDLAVTNGVLSASRATTFSVLTLKDNLFPVKTTLKNDALWYIFKKVSDGQYYGFEFNASNTTNKVYRLDAGANDSYTATSLGNASSSGVTSYTRNGTPNASDEVVVTLVNGELTVTAATWSIKLTNADCFGIFTSNKTKILGETVVLYSGNV